MTTVFISWVNRAGRSADLARRLGAFDWTSGGGRGPFLLRWTRSAIATVRVLERRAPDVVIVMQPPPVALWIVVGWAAVRGARVVGDMHTSALIGRKWGWAVPLNLAMLRRRGLALASNEALAERVRRRGVRALVLHDIIEPVDAPGATFDDRALDELARVRYLLVPLSYADDEPLRAILDATASRQDVRFVLTGPAPRAFRDAASANVLCTGMVSDADYRRLLGHAAGVVALTTWEWTMQRAGYEALMAAKPLVASDTAVLREYFGDAAVLVQPTAQGLAAGVDRLWRDLDRWSARMAVLRDVKVEEQRDALQRLAVWIEGSPVPAEPAR